MALVGLDGRLFKLIKLGIWKYKDLSGANMLI